MNDLPTTLPGTMTYEGAVTSRGLPFDIARAMFAFRGCRVKVTIEAVGAAPEEPDQPKCGDAFATWTCELAPGHDGDHGCWLNGWNEDRKRAFREKWGPSEEERLP